MAKKIEKEDAETQEIVDNFELDELKKDNLEKIKKIKELEDEVSSLISKYSLLENELKKNVEENKINIEFIHKMKDEIKTMNNNYKTNNKVDVSLKDALFMKGDSVYVKKYRNQVFNIIENIGHTNDGDVLYSLYDSLNLVEIDAYPQSKITKKL